jgi:hypothetical protein
MARRRVLHERWPLGDETALRASANVLEHSVRDALVDDEFLALARKNGTFYTPTFAVRPDYRLVFAGQWTATEAEKRLADPRALAELDPHRVRDDQWPPEVLEYRSTAKPIELKPSSSEAENLRRVRNVGIPVTVGTDAGNIS